MIYFIWESLFTSLVFENLALHVGWFIALNILNCTRHCFSESSEFLPAEFFYYHQLKLALPTLPWFYWAPSYPTFRINLVFSSFKGRNVQDEFVSLWFILPEDVDSKRREAVTQRRDVICRKKWFLDIWVIIDPWEHLKMLFIQWHFSIKLLTVEWEMNDDLIRKWQDGLGLFGGAFPAFCYVYWVKARKLMRTVILSPHLTCSICQRQTSLLLLSLATITSRLWQQTLSIFHVRSPPLGRWTNHVGI